MHFEPLILKLEGPGPWNSRGQAAFNLAQLRRGAGSVQLSCPYLGT